MDPKLEEYDVSEKGLPIEPGSLSPGIKSLYKDIHDTPTFCGIFYGGRKRIARKKRLEGD